MRLNDMEKKDIHKFMKQVSGALRKLGSNDATKEELKVCTECQFEKRNGHAFGCNKQ